MSKLIVEMEMPHSCFDCPCHNREGGYYCQVDKYHRYIYNDIPLWCPIVGILPEEHGDLIDRDALFLKYKEQYDFIDEEDILNAETIIAAEGRDVDK